MKIALKNISILILLFTIVTAVALASQQNNNSEAEAATIAAAAAATTDTTKEQDANENGSLAMVILLSAGSLAFSFFRYVGTTIYSIITTLLLPFYYVLKFCWRNIVTRPFALLMNVGHALYPVAMFCLAAVCCGTLIGGCAGFAAEAIASFTISTTWGRSASTSNSTKQRQQPANYQHSYYDYLNEDDDDDDISTVTQSEVSSQWDPTFFGEQPLGTKDKERIDHWRQNLLPKTRRESGATPGAKTRFPQSSSSSMRFMATTDYDQQSSMQLPPQVNDDLQEAMDDWAWDEDDEDDDLDEYPRLRRRSVVR